ncbi:TPA: hypothetical protein EYP13_02635 [Candidatus Micrarchaeota archaeon]|nr:hypothetical protein [Candidatus Micrarchaeota archaeon]
MRGIWVYALAAFLVIVAAAILAHYYSSQSKSAQEESPAFEVLLAVCDGRYVCLLIANKSDKPIDADASVALIDASGSVIDEASPVRVSVPARDTGSVSVVFSRDCNAAAAVRVTIGSSSAEAPLR